MTVRCPICGREIRYITAAPSLGNNGIIPVDLELHELISETGRLLRGYRTHECKNGGNDGRETESGEN